MISQGIVIPWIYSDEYIQIDFSEIQNTPTIKQTIDVPRESDDIQKLFVESKWEGPDKNGEYHLTLTYNKNNNSHIKEDGYDTFWGKATIDINIDNKSGKAYWHGLNTKKWDGYVEWKKIDEELIDTRENENVNRIKRKQGQLRQTLLTLDARCAISGEELPEVLEA